jgi:hypothetical protein
MEPPEEPGRFKAGEETESARAEELTEAIHARGFPQRGAFR